MKLITWNIQWCRGVDGRVDPARIASEARRLADFDVLCLQEVAIGFDGLAGSRGEDQVAALAAALPGYQAFFGAATDLPDGRGGRRQFGNAVMTRLPVLQVFRHSLPWPAEATVPSMQRLALEVVVEAPFGPLRVTTTHLEYYSAAQRMAQVDALRRLHAEACAHGRHPRPSGDPGEPFEAFARPAAAIVCGDCNFTPDAAEHARMTAPFGDGSPRFADAWMAHHPGQPHPDSWGVHGVGTPGCVDFVFVTEDLAGRLTQVEIDATSQASDHQPVVVTFAA